MSRTSSVSRTSKSQSSALTKFTASASSLSTGIQRASAAKLLLHVLDLDELPYEMVTKPKKAAFRGQKDVYIARAELELKKVMHTMSFSSRMLGGDLSMLTALSLPNGSAAVIWTVHALLQGQFQKENDPGHVHHRNRDAQILYRQLAHMNLMPWAHQLVDQVNGSDLVGKVYMPPGHPLPGYTYRRHPFKQRHNFYYPVSRYFSMLYEEREQAMIALFAELGATKITISSPIKANACEGIEDLDLHQRVFEYPELSAPLPKTIDMQRHPWLTCEPKWQGVVRERLNRGILSTQFEFDLDVVNMLRSQIKSITRLVTRLDSMDLCDTCEEKLLLDTLQPRKVKIEFSNIQKS